jgi:hypothetical protein
MTALSASHLLDTWERGLSQRPLERAITLLTAAQPGAEEARLAALPVGQRDAELLRLRERLFGSTLSGLAACPDCGQRVELAIDIALMLSSQPQSGAEESIEARIDGYDVRFRLPATADLIAAVDARSPEEAADLLLHRCVLAVERDGHPVTITGSSPPLLDAIVARMSEADPLAEIELACDCPVCRASWRAPLDIVAFLWSELHAWATRTLREVNALASGYGWREADILALSPRRRQCYLELLAG